jgi:hypothetical protein
MKFQRNDSTRQKHFSLTTTKTFFLILVVLYFIVPSIISQYVFDNVFYIYSEYQQTGNKLSLIFGVFLIAWVLFLLPKNVSRNNPIIERISRSRLFEFSYYLFIGYLVLLACYGVHLRMGGAGRSELLDGVDHFLLPGMSFFVINCAVHCIQAKGKIKFVTLVVLCFVVDAIFNGKIFSFLAVGLIFFYLDYINADKRVTRRVLLYTLLLSFLMIVFIGLSRTFLSGGDVGTDVLSIVYLTGSEFLGVQASVGWAVSYFMNSSPTDLFTFGATLQNSYRDSVGHGLATSPVAYFVGNFGNWALPVGFAVLGILAMIIRVSRTYLSWVIFVILILNFQHFLRHGFDVFSEKLITQLFYFYLLYLVYSIASNSEQSSERIRPSGCGVE